MSSDVKAFLTIVLTIVVAVAMILGLVWALNHQDWDAERLRRTHCVEQGGAYIKAVDIEGCIKIQSSEVETER